MAYLHITIISRAIQRVLECPSFKAYLKNCTLVEAQFPANISAWGGHRSVFTLKPLDTLQAQSDFIANGKILRSDSFGTALGELNAHLSPLIAETKVWLCHEECQSRLQREIGPC